MKFCIKITGFLDIVDYPPTQMGPLERANFNHWTLIYNTDLIFHLNSIPKATGTSETDSSARTMSRLECGLATAKFRPFLKTVFSESVQIFLIGLVQISWNQKQRVVL
jgi:hypothetical protein